MNTAVPRTIRKITFPTGRTLEICMGDITLINCDVIVNAANEHLMHGGGVATAISRCGGLTIQRESHAWVAAHGPISHDKPAFTSGGDLNCKFVIHAIGPRWGEGNEDIKLAKTIYSCLQLANKLEAESISFPAISTGIFGFPVERAAKIILEEITSFSQKDSEFSIKNIILALFYEEILNTFVKSFDAILNQRKPQ